MTATAVVDRVHLGDHVCWAHDDDRAALDSYVRLGSGGRLAVEPMIESLAGEITRAHREGHAGLRVAGDMGWIQRTGTGLDELSRYEAQVNRLFLDRRVAGMCLYDGRLFAPEQLRAVAAAHPATVGPYADRGWTPLLRAYRTADPPGLRLVGQVDRSNQEAFAAVLAAVHEGLFYTDAAGLLAGTVPFVQDGLAAGEPVLVATPGPQLELIRAAVGPTGDAVRYADMTDAGRNPGRIIPWVLQAFADRHSGRRVRIIGEPIWAGRTEQEYPACAQHEASINWALNGREVTMLCPYDAARLDPVVLAEARCTHPVLVDRAGRRPGAGYAPADVVARHNKPLPAPDQQVATFRYDLETLPRVRRFVADHAAGAGLDAERIADLQIAVTELATNSVAHAGGAGTLQVWLTGTHLVCEIHDDGWLADPLAGRLAPAHDGIGGRGLVIVHALCDLVRVHTTAAGTTVRLYMLRGALA